jgi:acetyltransferase
MRKGDINRMLNPETVALIGATEKEGSIGRTLLENLHYWSLERKIFPVNPRRKKALGLPCYPTISDVPAHVDLAVIATPAPTVPSMVQACGEAEVEGIIIVSAGFREVGEEGKKLEEQVRDIREKFGMRIIGPNCLGIIRPSIGLNASILKAPPREGNIAFISQSGALGGAIFDWATLAHAGFSIFASLGSMVDVDFGDLVDFLSSDSHTRSIVFYMEEGTGDIKRFVSAVKGFARYKPIVVVKPGRFTDKPAPALSHAGSLVTNDQVYDAAFKRVSIVRVKEVADLFNTVRVLHAKHLPQGPRLAIVTNASGVAVMATDALIALGGEVVELSEESIKNLDSILPSYWSKGNPVDVFRDSDLKRYEEVIKIFLDDPGADGILIIYTSQDTPRPKELAKAISNIARETWKPMIAAWIGGKEVQEGKDILFQNAIPTYDTPEDAVKAYLSMYHYKKSLEIQYETPAELTVNQAPAKNNLKAFIRRAVKQGELILNEKESFRFLTTYGIPALQAEITQSVEEAVSQANHMGYPVVLKIVSPEIICRSDVGGVVTGIHSDEELRFEYERLLQRTKEYAPKARLEGIVVQKMIEKIDYEIFLGAKKDKDFGSVIVFGIGGVGIEIFKDFSIGLPPLNQALARRLMEESRVYKMVQGSGLKPPADLRQLEQIIVSFSNLISDFPEISEMDVNPLAISKGHAFALAARIIIDKDSLDYKSSYPHLVIAPYPTRYVMSWRDSDGTEALLRPIKPEDEPLVRDMLSSLSKETLKERFFQVIRTITHEMLIRLCNIDYDREMTMAVEIKEGPNRTLIGLGGLMIEPDLKKGEFAVLVHDRYQGKGLGYKLMDILIGIAQEKGLEEFYGMVLSENKRMLHLCQKLGFTSVPNSDGVTHVSLMLK